jgi:hypothetical protein
VISKAKKQFWKCFDGLPKEIQALAREKFRLWQSDPYAPSLRFEERRNGFCVVRVGDHYRAVGTREGEIVLWYWIGTHEEYNRFRF